MTGSLRAVAVDDEPLALKRIEMLLTRIPDVELTGTALDGVEALQLVAQLRPDVVLLDIKMPGLSGFDLVKQFDETYVPAVIFATAFDHFAIKAFDVGAVDYVLKPVELSRLAAALDRARRSLAALDAEQRIQELRAVVAALCEQTRESEATRYETEIWAERRKEFVRVPVADLDWVAAERDYVRLHAKGQSYLLRETMANVQVRLDPQQFVRLRRSALVRIDRVSAIRKAAYGDFRATLADGSEVRVGRTYVKQVRALISPRTRAPMDE